MYTGGAPGRIRMSDVSQRVAILFVDPSPANLAALLKDAKLKVLGVSAEVAGAAQPCRTGANHCHFLH